MTTQSAGQSLKRLLIPSGRWREFAACRLVDPDLFFPVSSGGASREQVARAKAVCARCLVQRDCMEFALRTRQAHGIWGGTTEEERRPARYDAHSR